MLRTVVRFGFAVFVAACLLGVALFFFFECYLQLGAALALLGTDAAPIETNALLGWVSMVLPGQATLVEVMAFAVAASFAFGCAFATRMLGECFDLAGGVRELANRQDERVSRLRSRMWRHLLNTTMMCVLAATVAYVVYHLLVFRAVLNATGADVWSMESLDMLPWHLAAEEYGSSYPFWVGRVWTAGYLAACAMSAITLDLALCNVRQRWDEVEGAIDDYALIDVPAGAEQAEEELVEPTSVETASPWAEPDAHESAAGSGGPPNPVVVRFDRPQAAHHANTDVGGGRRDPSPAAEPMFSVLGRPGVTVTWSEAVEDSALLADPVNRTVWDRRYFEQLNEVA